MTDRRRRPVCPGGILLLGALWLAAAPAVAQLAEKPSVYTAKRRGEPMPPALAAPAPVANPSAAEQRGLVAAPGRAGSAAAATGPAYLGSVSGMEQFRQIARVYNADSPEPLVHTIFAIDRADGNRLYLINANRYPLHEDFVRAHYLVPQLDEKQIRGYYERADRRFLFGTIGLQPRLKRWTFEFWEGDRTSETLIRLAGQSLAAAFFEPLVFKANSTEHEAVARAAGIDFVTEAQIIGDSRFMALNTGRAQGRLRLVERLDDESLDDIEPTDIVVLKEVPLSLSPVAGVLTEKASTALSHVNLLVKGWGVPNAYLRDAFRELKDHDGRWVDLRVSAGRYELSLLPGPVAARPAPPVKLLARPDLSLRQPLPLREIAGRGRMACGSKAVNLSRIEAARRLGSFGADLGLAPVPDGFCIPYAHYASFMATPQARALIGRRLASPGFERSRSVRRQALERLRGELAALPLDPALSARWLAQWHAQLAGRSVFVRSSSNAEDLSNFSGAGLYTTVPNARSDAALLQAVKTVWASVYNAEAYEARRAAGVPDSQVFMGVLVQQAVESVLSGVMVTRDPFDASHLNATYVSAKRGLGIKVVEGRRIAEQSMHDSWSDAVRRLSRSEELSELQLDPSGGVVDRPLVPDAVDSEVLSTPRVRQLAGVGRRLKALFGLVDQDIEWAIDPAGRIVVLQSRPYVERKSW